MSNTLTLDADPYEGSATFDLDRACRSLFGEDWAAPLSRLTGVSMRTCQRVRAAARSRTDHEAAEGVLSGLIERLTTLAAEADPETDRLRQELAPAGERYGRFLTRSRISNLLSEDDGAVWPDDRVVGPLRVFDVKEIVRRGEAYERAAKEACHSLAALLNGLPSDPAALGAGWQGLGTLAKLAASFGAKVTKNADGVIGVRGYGDDIFSGLLTPPNHSVVANRFLLQAEASPAAWQRLQSAFLTDILTQTSLVEVLTEDFEWRQAMWVTTSRSDLHDMAERLKGELLAAAATEIQVEYLS